MAVRYAALESDDWLQWMNKERPGAGHVRCLASTEVERQEEMEQWPFERAEDIGLVVGYDSACQRAKYSV